MLELVMTIDKTVVVGSGDYKGYYVEKNIHSRQW